MFKKLLATAILVCSLPVLANAAWQFTTQAKTGGGTITTPKLAGQTANQSVVYKNYTTHAQPQAVTVTANQNYTISKIVKNGVTILNPASPYITSVNGGAAGTTANSLYATFLAQKLSVTASVTNPVGGSVSPESVANVFPGYQYAKLTFKFTPKSGYNVLGITGVGTFTVSSALPAAVNEVVTVIIPVGTVLTSGVNLVGTFDTSAPRANAGPDQTVTPSTPVTLTGSGTFGVFEKWSSASRPALAAQPFAAGATNPQGFTPTVEGTYTFMYRVADGIGLARDFVNVIVTSAAPATITQAVRNDCYNCHAANGVGVASGTFNNWSGSVHKDNGKVCYNCHSGANVGGHPGTITCTGCHGTLAPVYVSQCAGCHTGSDVHGAKVATASTNNDCVGCHDLGFHETGGNNGVRAVVAEFGKWSHHVTGRAVNNTDCATCHLEGKASAAAIVIDPLYHNVDGNIHLRNANAALAGNQSTATLGAGGQSEYLWNPAAPNHTLMDQFCMSCHNGAGAVTAVAALSTVPPVTVARTAINPFGDTISNEYDQAIRPGVVAVFEQFDTANTSHHAVRGQRYTTTTLSAAAFTNISAANNNPAYKNSIPLVTGTNNNLKQVRNTLSKTGLSSPILANTYNDIDGAAGTLTFPAALTPEIVAANTPPATQPPFSSPTGFIGTLFQTGKFITAYTTIGTANTIADTTMNHCGDCHTVGQFRASDVNLAVGSYNKAVIGAHGSANEYMLRNNQGTDVLTPQALVCFNCHAEAIYGNYGHEGTNSADQDCNGDFYNAAGTVGAARLLPDEGAITDAAFQAEVADGMYKSTGGGNIFAYKCGNCHNASDKKTFGGIHGNASHDGTVLNASYTSYSSSTASGAQAFTAVDRKPYRFLPGLGNFRYNGGHNEEAWTRKILTNASRQGCYTITGYSATGVLPNPAPTKADASGANVSVRAIAGDNGILGSWGACTDHAGSSTTGSGRSTTRTNLRPLTY